MAVLNEELSAQIRGAAKKLIFARLLTTSIDDAEKMKSEALAELKGLVKESIAMRAENRFVQPRDIKLASGDSLAVAVAAFRISGVEPDSDLREFVDAMDLRLHPSPLDNSGGAIRHFDGLNVQRAVFAELAVEAVAESLGLSESVTGTPTGWQTDVGKVMKPPAIDASMSTDPRYLAMYEYSQRMMGVFDTTIRIRDYALAAAMPKRNYLGDPDNVGIAFELSRAPEIDLDAFVATFASLDTQTSPNELGKDELDNAQLAIGVLREMSVGRLSALPAVARHLRMAYEANPQAFKKVVSVIEAVDAPRRAGLFGGPRKVIPQIRITPSMRPYLDGFLAGKSGMASLLDELSTTSHQLRESPTAGAVLDFALTELPGARNDVEFVGKNGVPVRIRPTSIGIKTASGDDVALVGISVANRRQVRRGVPDLLLAFETDAKPGPVVENILGKDDFRALPEEDRYRLHFATKYGEKRDFNLSHTREDGETVTVQIIRSTQMPATSIQPSTPKYQVVVGTSDSLNPEAGRAAFERLVEATSALVPDIGFTTAQVAQAVSATAISLQTGRSAVA